jgi:hypothetical protein
VAFLRLHSEPLNDRNRECLLKNSLFVSNSQNLGDRKCLAILESRLPGPPDAIFIFANFVVESFSTPTGDYAQNPSMSVMAIFQQLKAEVRVWTWDWMYYNLRAVPQHSPVVPVRRQRLQASFGRLKQWLIPWRYVFAHYVLKDGDR